MFKMPILPLFNTNNTFQGLKRVVREGRKEAGRRKEQTRREKLQREAKIAIGNESFSHFFFLSKLRSNKGLSVFLFLCFIFLFHSYCFSLYFKGTTISLSSLAVSRKLLRMTTYNIKKIEK